MICFTLVFNSENDAKELNNYMFHKGIILRHLAGWGLPNCIRVTIGTEIENNYFIESLSKVLPAV